MATYLSADDFIKGIAGTAEDLTIEGLGTIRVKSLSVLEVKQIDAQGKGNEIEMGMLMAAAGIVEPKLSAEQIEQLQHARPGVIAQISRRVSQLSGMAKESENLAGAGS